MSAARVMMEAFTMALPIIVIIVIVVIKAVAASGKNGKSGRPAQTGQGGTPYGQGGNSNGYAAGGNVIHNSRMPNPHGNDRQEEYQRRLDQLKNLYDSGMMDKDEYSDRRNSIEDDYRNGRQL